MNAQMVIANLQRKCLKQNRRIGMEVIISIVVIWLVVNGVIKFILGDTRF